MNILEFIVLSAVGIVVIVLLVAVASKAIDSLTNDKDPWKNND